MHGAHTACQHMSQRDGAVVCGVSVHTCICLPIGSMMRMHGRPKLLYHEQWRDPTNRGRVILELVVGDLVLIRPEDLGCITELDLLTRDIRSVLNELLYVVMHWRNGRLMCVSVAVCIHYSRCMHCNGWRVCM